MAALNTIMASCNALHQQGWFVLQTFTLQHINHIRVTFIADNCFLVWMTFRDFYMRLNATLQYACSGPTPRKPVSLIMRMSGFLRHASRGFLSRLGMGHSGHGGQPYHGSPAGSGSSGPADWPQSSWTDRSPGCRPLPSPWSSGSRKDPDGFSDGSSNQTACAAG